MVVHVSPFGKFEAFCLIFFCLFFGWEVHAHFLRVTYPENAAFAFHPTAVKQFDVAILVSGVIRLSMVGIHFEPILNGCVFDLLSHIVESMSWHYFEQGKVKSLLEALLRFIRFLKLRLGSYLVGDFWCQLLCLCPQSQSSWPFVHAWVRLLEESLLGYRLIVIHLLKAVSYGTLNEIGIRLLLKRIWLTTWVVFCKPSSWSDPRATHQLPWLLSHSHRLIRPLLRVNYRKWWSHNLIVRVSDNVVFVTSLIIIDPQIWQSLRWLSSLHVERVGCEWLITHTKRCEIRLCSIL